MRYLAPLMVVTKRFALATMISRSSKVGVVVVRRSSLRARLEAKRVAGAREVFVFDALMLRRMPPAFAGRHASPDRDAASDDPSSRPRLFIRARPRE